MAVEDIGLADPQAQAVCLDSWQTYERLGSPEGELALAQALVYLALAPKSNAVYTAYKAARAAARETGSQPPPLHIRNAPTKLMKDIGYGTDYAYDHDAEDGFSGQNYFPDGMKRPVYYLPPERGFERELNKRIDYFAKLRAKRQTP
jgi:putative ATPase